MEVGCSEGQFQHTIDIFREHDQGFLHQAIAVSKDSEGVSAASGKSRKDLKDLFSKDVSL